MSDHVSWLRTIAALHPGTSTWDKLNEAADAWAEMASEVERLSAPIDMILHCPACLEQHIDEPEMHAQIVDGVDVGDDVEGWTNPPHRSHLCQHCGFQWRPADVATNGVAKIKTQGKNDMVLIDGPAHELRMARLAKSLENPPKLEWDGERP